MCRVEWIVLIVNRKANQQHPHPSKVESPAIMLYLMNSPLPEPVYCLSSLGLFDVSAAPFFATRCSS